MGGCAPQKYGNKKTNHSLACDSFSLLYARGDSDPGSNTHANCHFDLYPTNKLDSTHVHLAATIFYSIYNHWC